MEQKQFVYQAVEVEGKTFHRLTAAQYPWINLQVIECRPDEFEDALEKVKAHEGYAPSTYPGRRDFCIIQAGGSAQPLKITQQNYKEVVAAIVECCHDAATAWATGKGIVRVFPTNDLHL